jgi:hypothetical protein
MSPAFDFQIAMPLRHPKALFEAVAVYKQVDLALC